MCVEWCAPRSGRVETGLAWLTSLAFAAERDQQFFWIGPDYTAALAAFTAFKSSLTADAGTPALRAASFVTINGAILRFLAADNPATLVSDQCFGALVDQAALIAERAWSVLRESLAATRAPCRLVSTVAGRSTWFNEIARRTESLAPAAYARFTADDALAEGFLTSADIEQARASLPAHTFRALYYAEPYEDRIERSATSADPRLMSDEELALIAGIDLGGAKLYKPQGII